ncbi:hypothetical protein [Mycoplana dimorpha]|uniref:Uncharacterized protein n=1 Tax=Mycoplana dimorpha TaxID=28320 RepID=A0A2T5B1M6_MYCDI|nr:hypothetical protein [Mycoplana dimorpha]PTM92868.1 hypothetical protein C7449_107282 [Mycoplana dimorpha]
MENVNAIAYVNFGDLAEQQRDKLAEGLNACYAFWIAAQKLPNYTIEEARPHNRCIYAALAVRDILNRSGRSKAEVYTCGLEVRLVDGQTGDTKKGIAVGRPFGPSGRKDWNAHLVVKFGGFLFDPTLIQTRRPWNKLPYIGAILHAAPEWHELPMEGGPAKTRAVAITPLHDDYVQLAYFEIPQAEGFETRSYKTSSNSAARQRRDVVAKAGELLKANITYDTRRAITQLIDIGD